jgi:hypothetical protein
MKQKWTLLFYDYVNKTWDVGNYNILFDTKEAAEEHKKLMSTRGGHCPGHIKVLQLPSCDSKD